MIQLYEYKGDGGSWDAFVEGHPEGRFFQLTGYKNALKEAYGYESAYLVARNDRDIAAALPAFVLKNNLRGRSLVSSPFAEYGGLLGVDLSEDDVQEVVSRLRSMLRKQNIEHLEIHGGLGLPVQEMQDAFVERPMYHYAVLELGSVDEIWNDVVDYQVRKAVHKAERSGLRAYMDSTEAAVRDKFYPLYLISMKRLGTPPHPLSLFTGYARHLPDNLKIAFVDTSDGQTIAGLMGFALGRRVHIIHTVSDPEHWDKRPNDLAHWEFIRWACENSYELFDFSVVRYEGQARYKKKWGVQLYDYSYYYLFPDEDSSKEVVPVDASLRTARAFSWLWRQCAPLRITELAGKSIRKRLGR